jgi:hypothetical protein
MFIPLINSILLIKLFLIIFNIVSIFFILNFFTFILQILEIFTIIGCEYNKGHLIKFNFYYKLELIEI